MGNLLRVDELQIELITARRRRPRGRRRLVLHRRRRNRHHHRRIRVRQVDHRDGHPRPAARRPGGAVGCGEVQGHRHPRQAARRWQKVRGQPHRADPAGSDDRAEPGAHRRVAAARRDPPQRRHRPSPTQTARAVELLEQVKIPTPDRAAREVSAPAVRRHAAARPDRRRAGRRARTDRRRRADQRPGRHRAGQHPRPAAGTSGTHRGRHAADHPRPRRRAADVGPHLRDEGRSLRRERQRRRAAAQPAERLHQDDCSTPCRGWTATPRWESRHDRTAARGRRPRRRIPGPATACSARSTPSASPSRRARRWRSSANPAAASRHSPSRSSGCSPRPRGAS